MRQGPAPREETPQQTVSPSSRHRLIEAMTQTVAKRGYLGASIAQVTAAAGVARATFYEHFHDREECFLAAYREAVEVLEGIRAQAASPDTDPYATLAALIDATFADRARARLLLIEALAGPPGLRRAHQRLLLAAEQELLSGPGWRLRMPPAALQGGLVAVLGDALVDQRTPSIHQLLPELGAWLRSYAGGVEAADWEEPAWDDVGRCLAAPPAPRNATLGTLLPRGRNALSVAASAAHRRQRILAAICEVAADEGYAATTVADIVAAARVTRGAFYSHFHCKQDAFLAALTQSLQESVAAAAGRFFLGESWPERVWMGLEAFLSYIAQHPHAAHLGIVEIYAAGEPALKRARENRLAFTLFLADGYQQTEAAGRLPALCSEAIAGALEAILRRQLLAGRCHRSLELLPQCAYVALAPFIGPRPAWKFIESQLPAAVSAA
jgi:AcrR family transcriptional regulator